MYEVSALYEDTLAVYDIGTVTMINKRLRSAGDQLPAAAQQAAEPEPVPILSHF